MTAERIIGVVLIALGILLFVLLQAGVGAEMIPLLIGVAFLVAYAATRNYGLLIPGAILAGLGTGVVLTTAGAHEAAPVLGLGLGFVLIAVVDLLVAGRRAGGWWPLIPGGILTVVGLGAIPATRDALRYVVPLALIGVGVWLVVSRSRRGGAEPAESRPQAESGSHAPAGTVPEPPDEGRS